MTLHITYIHILYFCVVDVAKVLSLQEVTYDGVTLNLQPATGVKHPQLLPVHLSFSEPQVANGNILVVIRSR